MRLNRNLSSYKDYLIFFLLIFISLILISSNQNQQVEYFKMWMVGMIGTVQERWNAIQDYMDLKQRNEELLLENTRLALENAFMYEMRLENERLRELIGFKENKEMKLTAARVIGRGTTGFLNGIVLDVGLEDSVAKNMPLVVSSGLVGKLYQVGKKHSIGHLLIDQNFRVSGKIQRSRVRGIVSWEGGEFCLLKEVPKRSDVKVGDWVITSGYGEIFPPGLKIGRVINVTESPRGLFMNIKILPSVDFDKLEEVFVVSTKKSRE